MNVRMLNEYENTCNNYLEYILWKNLKKMYGSLRSYFIICFSQNLSTGTGTTAGV